MRMTRRKIPQNLTKVTPQEFERIVQEYLESEGAHLEQFKTRHLEPVHSSKGTFEIDVTARFRAIGVDFLVLVECKHHKNAIKRDDVLALHAKIQSTNAQKGILFASTDFQSGAIKFARANHIALIRVADGATAVISLSQEPVARSPYEAESLGFVLWLNTLPVDGDDAWELIGAHAPSRLLSILDLMESQ